MYTATTATKKLLKLNKRIRAIAGGTAASKTISVLLILIDKAQSEGNILISVVSESLPHLKRGAMRDFLNIMKEHGYYKESEWNRTDSIYTFSNGSKIEFFGADSPDKVRGPRRDVLFLNEANNMPLDTFDQLEVRTRKEIWLDWNPTHEFWFYTDVLTDREEDTEFITLTYKDNEALDPSIIKAIEDRRSNVNWWRVYGEGKLGEVESRIYKGWQKIDEVPFEARLERYGLDFGYSNDPTAIVAIYRHNEGYILDEILYRKGMSNKAIADYLKNVPQALVIADSSEPKSIDEIKSYGVTILGAEKGPGSVNKGIDRVQSLKVSVTKRSTNLLKEYRNYLWKTDKDGKIINAPDKFMDHCMDALRYAINSMYVQQTRAPQIYKPQNMLKRKYR